VVDGIGTAIGPVVTSLARAARGVIEGNRKPGYRPAGKDWNPLQLAGARTIPWREPRMLAGGDVGRARIRDDEKTGRRRLRVAVGGFLTPACSGWATKGPGMWGTRDDMVVHSMEPFNAEPTPAALTCRALTRVEAFYSRNHAPFPNLDSASWRLCVDGLVNRELALFLTELQARFAPRTEVATLVCAGNRRAELLAVQPIPGQVPWGPATISTAHGPPPASATCSPAGPGPGAAHVALVAADVSPSVHPPQPYGSSIPLPKARAGVLLAWAMHGEPLPRTHGGRCGCWCLATSEPAA
jgi:DMSO/TMAO reductase YedYZ molybdopterin-dependent catalytic subunit